MKKFNASLLIILFLCLVGSASIVEGLALEKDKDQITSENTLNFIADEQNLKGIKSILLEDGHAQDQQYVPGEIIIKFNETSSGLTSNLKNAAERESDFIIKVSRIQGISELPEKVKSLVEEDTALEPLFKALHEQMRSQSKTELEITKKKYTAKAKKRRRSSAKFRNFNLSNIYILENIKTRIPLKQICQVLSKDPSIEYAEPNYLYKATYIPNDPYYSTINSWGQGFDDLWGLKPDKLNCAEAWDTAEGEGIVVAVIDTGVDYNHEDIIGNMWDDGSGHYGYDFVNDDGDPMDGHGHGTHCSGTIAAVGNNNKGIIGISHKTKIMALKGLSDSGGGNTEHLANCVYYAANNGADILSNSWGGSQKSLAMEDAFNYAYLNMGCLSIAGAGNDDKNLNYFKFYPACYANVVAISATDVNDEKADFSNYGDKIEVSAPGVGILSLRAEGTDMYGDGIHIVATNYYWANGTSMACPHAAGVAALALSNNLNYTNLELRSVLRQGVDDLGTSGKDPIFGYGRVDAGEILLQQPQPSYELAFEDFTVDDSSGNNNGVIDPSETVDIGIELQNNSLSVNPLTNINGVLSTIDPEISIVVASANYGSIASGHTGFSTIPFTITVSEQVEPGTTLEFTMSITTGEGYQENLNVQIPVVNVPHMQGWPYYLHSSPSVNSSWLLGAVVVDDLNRDGNQEIIINAVEFDEIWQRVPTVRILDKQGDVLPGWPQLIYSGIPTVADLDNDGIKEIILNEFGENPKVHVLNIDGSVWENSSGNSLWPVSTGAPFHLQFDVSGCNPPPLVEDIDGDGELEIIISETVTEDGYYNGPKSPTIRVYELDGTEKWSTEFTAANGKDSLLFDSSVLFDVDENGEKDIVFWLNINDNEVWHTELVALNPDGEPVEGFDPYVATYIPSGLAVGDLDNDGEDELAFFKDQYIIVFKDGVFTSISYVPTYCLAGGSLALADLDNDDDLEILFRGLNGVFAYHHTGDVIFGWPQYFTEYNTHSLYPFLSRITVADLNGDNTPEVALPFYCYSTTGLPEKLLRIWEADGSLLKEYPLDNLHKSQYSPALKDLDNDGDMDLIYSVKEIVGNDSDMAIYALDISQDPYNSVKQEWTQFCYNEKHTATYQPNIYGAQQVTLLPGFNFVSSRIAPEDPDMLVVVEEILSDDLLYIRNSDGAMLRKIGQNWVNGIGDWITTEGYLVKIDVAGTFTVQGAVVPYDTPIYLSEGFQFISYLPDVPIDALDAFDSILSDDLLYIRDSEGNMLRKIGPDWVNGIGNCLPAQAYLIKIASNATLIYPESGQDGGRAKKKKARKMKIKRRPSTFVFEGGNPADPVFTIYVGGLNIGDEVAAFSGDAMVGATTINSRDVLDNALHVFSALNSGQGYLAGEAITLKVWDAAAKEVVSCDYDIVDSYNEAYKEQVYPSEDGEYSVVGF